jgi:hypothetical protein
MDLPRFRELPPERRADQRARIMAGIVASPRRRRTLGIAIALAVLLATPAFALHRQVVDFFSSEEAPEAIQLDFDKMRRVHEDARDRGFGGPAIVPVGPAREVLAVTVEGERRPLWVVPAGGGGYCFRWHFMASCGRIPGYASAEMKIAGGGLSNEDGVEGLALVVGQVLAPEVHELEMLYQDGERAKIPFVWVSPPIDAGFYAFEVPEEHRRPGHLTFAVIGLDADGNEVARQCLPLSPEALRSSRAADTACERPRRD